MFQLFLFLFIILGIMYVYQLKKNIEKYNTYQCNIESNCNKRLIANSINRISKKYYTLENNLKSINAI